MLPLLLSAAIFSSCTNSTSSTSSGGAEAGADTSGMTVGVAFETLQTEYWVASFEAIKDELKKRGITMVDAVADGDANRQLEQVNNFVAQGVDGIIVVPKDAKTVIPMIKAANAAGIPIVLYNRPADTSNAKAAAVVADNYAITKDTVTYMAEQARQSGRKHKAMVLIGDLGDINAIERRRGFQDALKSYSDVVEVVAEVPTEWNQEKALAGVTNALQANPGISFIFTSSDFLFPSIISALKTAGKYKKVGEEGHVLLGGFDGDATAYQMLNDGYLDADGVQDMEFESAAAVQAILDMKAGKTVSDKILDKGFVIHQDNLKEMAARMWGAKQSRKDEGRSE